MAKYKRAVVVPHVSIPNLSSVNYFNLLYKNSIQSTISLRQLNSDTVHNNEIEIKKTLLSLI